MEPIRVLLTDLPSRMLVEIIRSITSQRTDIEIIGNPVPRSILASAVRSHRPDVVVIGLKAKELTTAWSRLVDGLEVPSVVAVASQGSQLFVHAVRVKDPGIAEFMNAIRAAAELGGTAAMRNEEKSPLH